MTEVVRLRAHEQNIERYHNLLKTKLSDVEQQFVERRLSEERFRIAKLRFMNPSADTAIIMRDPSKAS